MGCTVCNFIWTKDMKDGELLAMYSFSEMTKEEEREAQDELAYDIAYNHAWMIGRSIKYWFKIRWHRLWSWC